MVSPMRANEKTDTNKLIWKTVEAHSHGTQIYGYQREKQGRDKLGVWD